MWHELLFVAINKQGQLRGLNRSIWLKHTNGRCVPEVTKFYNGTNGWFEPINAEQDCYR